MSGKSPYRLLEPAAWLNLLTRAAIFHASRERLSRLFDAADHPDIQNVLSELSASARNLPEDADDDTAVEAVTAAWAAAINRKLAQPKLDNSDRQLLLDLLNLVTGASLSNPLVGILEGIETRARDLYGASWRSVRLSVAPIQSHPHGQAVKVSDDPYTISALTSWPPEPDVASVQLIVYDEFGPAAFAAVPMLLMHECICHVPARHDDDADNQSTFLEGFVDWAAHYFLSQWMGTLDPPFAAAARTHAERLKHVLTGRPSDGTARTFGHEAADTLQTWFENTCGLTPDESKARVARLGVELNQLDHPLVLKDHFISKIYRPLPGDLAGPLRQWISGNLPTRALLA